MEKNKTPPPPPPPPPPRVTYTTPLVLRFIYNTAMQHAFMHSRIRAFTHSHFVAGYQPVQFVAAANQGRGEGRGRIREDEAGGGRKGHAH